MRQPRSQLIPSRECFERLLLRAQSDAHGNLGVFFHSFREYLLHIGHENMPRELWAKASPSDFVQETFLDVQKAFPHFHGHTVKEACSWLRTIYLRKVSRCYRRFVVVEKRQVAKEIPIDSQRGQVEMRHIAESTSNSPLDTAIEHEEDQLFRVAFNQLSSEYQRVIHLHVFENKPFRDIGNQLGCTAAAAQKLCVRAIKKLAQLGDRD